MSLFMVTVYLSLFLLLLSTHFTKGQITNSVKRDFFVDVLKRHLSKTDIVIREAGLICGSEDWSVCKDLIAYLSSRSFTGSIWENLTSAPIHNETEQIIFLVVSPGVLPTRSGIIQHSSKNMWYVPVEDEPFLDNSLLRLTSLVQLYGESRDVANGIDVTEWFRAKDVPLRRFRGSWSPVTGFMYEDTFLWERRYDLGGAHYNTVVEHFPPTSFVDIGEDNEVLGIKGVFPEIFFLMHQKFNFTYDMRLPPDRTWGSRTNGVWNGMVRMMQDKEVDFSFVLYSVSADRSEVMDFSNHIFFEILKLYMKKPASSFSAQMDAYFKDFEVTFWILFGATFSFLAFCYFLAEKLKFEHWHHKYDDEKFGITNGFGIVCLAIIQRDYPIRVSKPFAKVLYFTTIVLAFLLFEIYAASLTSVLTADVFDPPIKNLQDIIDKDYQVNVWTGTTYERYFKAAKPGTIQAKIWDDIIVGTDNQVKDVSTGLLKMISDENTVHYGPSLGIRGLFSSTLAYLKCDVVELKHQYQKLNSAMGFQKGSDLVPLFNYYIGTLTEEGHVHKLITKYMPPLEEGACAQSGPTPISFAQVFSAFSFLVGGGCIGMSLLIFERLLNCLVSEETAKTVKSHRKSLGENGTFW